MSTACHEDAAKDFPVIVQHFEKQGIQIEIDCEHPTGEDCIFDRKTGAWLGYVSMYCYVHDCMECETCQGD